VATIVGHLKSIGDIFGGKGKGAADFDENANAAAEKEAANTAASASANSAGAKEDSLPTIGKSKKGGSSSKKSGGRLKQRGGSEPGADSDSSSDSSSDISTDDTATDQTPAVVPAANAIPAIATAAVIPTGITLPNNTPPNDTTKTGFWDKNKKWLKPTLIGAGGIGLLAVGYHFLKPHHPPGSAPTPALTGAPKKKNHQRKNKHLKKKAVALM
jgi:hypothetical protein